MYPVLHNKITFGHEETQAVLETLSSGKWSVGNTVEVFEEKLAKKAKVKYAIWSRDQGGPCFG